MAGKEKPKEESCFSPIEVLKLLFFFSKLERNKTIHFIFDILTEFSKVTFRTVIRIIEKKKRFFFFHSFLHFLTCLA